MQLARAVRNRTTGVLYVLDEPSIGLHPSNLEGLTGVMDDLVADGNSVLLVDHDPQVLSHADWIVELGPGAGANGGNLIAEGTVADIVANPKSQIGPFLGGTPAVGVTQRPLDDANGGNAANIRLSTSAIHTVQPLEVSFPKGKLSVVTGVSGSGKTTLILESLVPGLAAQIAGQRLPTHVRSVSAPGIEQVKLIDATPIGINIRSTVATYANVHDELRKIYARTSDARERGYKAGDFSYNTGSLRCATCDGTGEISLDVQFLPDVDIPCPDCHGSRYGRAAYAVKRKGVAIPELMALSVDEALDACADLRLVKERLQVLHDLGLGYLTLGEETPGLSGGEAQRLKLASEMGRGQGDSLFVFDEPTIGLHPLDVRTLLGVFRHLIGNGATVIVIEHDLDVIRAADWVVDMGPGGGLEGGRIVATGTPGEIAANPESLTGRYLGGRADNR
jgi:excinuclease ABC subunit A